MDTTQLLKGVLDLAVLAVVADEDGYGYDVVRRLRAGGLEELGDASVYGTLRRLYAAGALTSYVVPTDEGPHRKYYGITGTGKAQLKQHREDWGPSHREHAASHRPAEHHRGDPMNDTVQTSPAVAAFVAQVRARLGDLTEEEREELLGGLEADLAERLAEGEADLGDPAAYAAELRAAAGLEARPRGWAVRRPAGTRRPLADHLSELLDAIRSDWERWVARDPRVAEAWQVTQAPRPAWWVLRAW